MFLKSEVSFFIYDDQDIIKEFFFFNFNKYIITQWKWND